MILLIGLLVVFLGYVAIASVLWFEEGMRIFPKFFLFPLSKEKTSLDKALALRRKLDELSAKIQEQQKRWDILKGNVDVAKSKAKEDLNWILKD